MENAGNEIPAKKALLVPPMAQVVHLISRGPLTASGAELRGCFGCGQSHHRPIVWASVTESLPALVSAGGQNVAQKSQL